MTRYVCRPVGWSVVIISSKGRKVTEREREKEREREREKERERERERERGGEGKKRKLSHLLKIRSAFIEQLALVLNE